MKQLERLLSILLVLLMTVSVTSCVSDDELGSQSGHDYFYAFLESDPSYYWVVDMNSYSRCLTSIVRLSPLAL